jgi:hypothetical protein
MEELLEEPIGRSMGLRGWAYVGAVALGYALLGLAAFVPAQWIEARPWLYLGFAAITLANMGVAIASLDSTVYIEVNFGEAKPGGSAVGYFPGKGGTLGEARWLGSGNASVPGTAASVEVSEKVFEACLKARRDRAALRAGRWLFAIGLLASSVWLMFALARLPAFGAVCVGYGGVIPC